MDIDGKDENAFSISFLKLSIDLSISNQFDPLDGVTAELGFASFFAMEVRRDKALSQYCILPHLKITRMKNSMSIHTKLNQRACKLFEQNT